MKLRRILLCGLLCGLLLTLCAVPSTAVPASAEKVQSTAPAQDAVLASRFLNLLNHNFAYGTDFLSVDALTDAAMPALLDYREGDFVRADVVADYLLNFYGITAVDFSGLHPQFPQQAGYVYIVPRGYALYRHTDAVLTANEDGSYTVTTAVEITAHDGTEAAAATSLFVPNEQSQFGWVLISSNLADGPAA